MTTHKLQETLQQKLGYQFQNPKLLELALTHASRGGQQGASGSNERLEFLGDRILGLVVAEWLFAEFPEEPEGVLSKRHAALVQQKTLAQVAENLSLGECLTLSRGEKKQGGQEKPSILSDAVEALIAAIYLDSNLTTAQQIIRKFLAEYMHSVPLKDSKSTLQELMQKQQKEMPIYTLKTVEGEAHNPLHIIEVVADGCQATGQGSSKKEAEQVAAENLLKQLNQKDS